MKKNSKQKRPKSRLELEQPKVSSVDPVLNKKRMLFDFDSSIIDKVNNNYISPSSNNKSASQWKYGSLITSEQQAKSKNYNQTNYNSISNTHVDDSDDDNRGIQNEDKFENELFEKECSFSDFKLSKLLLKACADLNFFHPTKVQAKVIPIISDKSDVLVNAETGI